jgi:LPXTG-site transpeptidase (sortase) family protein
MVVGFVGLGAAIVIVSVWLIKEYSQPITAPEQPAAYYSPDVPSEEPVTDQNHKSTTKPDEPDHINIPAIGAAGYISKVGIDQHKEIGVPGNIYIAGWFTDASTPGKPGLSIIDGHVDGLNKPGIFINIDKLKADDVIEIKMGDGKVLTYKVISVALVKNAEAPNVIFSQAPGVKSQLNLVTCGGTFNKKSGHYEQRVIVSSKLAG